MEKHIQNDLFIFRRKKAVFLSIIILFMLIIQCGRGLILITLDFDRVHKLNMSQKFLILFVCTTVLLACLIKLISLFKRSRLLVINNKTIVLNKFMSKRIIPIDENSFINGIKINKSDFSSNMNLLEEYHEFIKNNTKGLFGVNKTVEIEISTDNKKYNLQINIEETMVNQLLQFITSKIGNIPNNHFNK